MAGRPGAHLLEGAIDIHVHACPHRNARCLSVLDAVREAAAAGMRGLGLMDNFQSSAGYAALAMQELRQLGVQVFGGLVMEPAAGGVALAPVQAALDYGYAPGDGARFVSLPTHHTRHVARLEGRSPAHVEACLEIPERGPLPEPLPAILDLIAKRDVVLNTGHLAGPEAVRLVEEARPRGVGRILVPSSHYEVEVVREVTGHGAFAELSFFFLTHATRIGLTHVDAERHTIPATTPEAMAELVHAAGPQRTILSSDCGVAVLPPPVEGLREFLLVLAEAGIDEADLRRMITENPAALFGVS